MAGSFPQAGFYYQNIVAAQHILNLIDLGSNVHYIELDNLEKAQHIDDIIITYKDGSTRYYQVKWSGNDSNSYTLYNLAISSDDSNKSLIEQLATGYSRLTNKQNVEIILYTTRPVGSRKQRDFSHSLRDFLQDVHASYIEESVVKKLQLLPQFTNYRDVIQKLFKASKIDQEAEFCEFLHNLRFQLSQSSIEHQQNKLKSKLAELGIEQSLYDTLLNAVVEWSLPPRQQITASVALERLGLSERFVDRLSHDFKVEKRHYVQNSELFRQLDDTIAKLNNGFIFLEGAPGSGKSTALTIYQQQRDTISFAYYCYIPDEKHIGNARIERETFLKSLCIGIQNAFPDIDFPQKYSQDYEHKLNLWLHTLSKQTSKVVLIVDGLDHVDRKIKANELAEPLTNAFGGTANLPDNILFLISAQYIEALPSHIRHKIQNSHLRHIRIAKFSQAEISTYLESRGIQVDNELLPLVATKSSGIPLYLHYIANILQESTPYQYEYILGDLPLLEDDNINFYHAYLYQNLATEEITTYTLAVLAHRKEYTTIETLIEILDLMGTTVSRYQIEATLNSIKHLLNTSDAKSYALYHDSFREFILRQTQFLRDVIAEALIQYYQANPQADETYRNYFRHLFELGKYQEILDHCNRAWLELSWQDFRPFQETNNNLDLAWQACIEVDSYWEFVRLAFLKYQFHLISYYVQDIADFKASLFFLAIGNTNKALRHVWDGVSLQVTQSEFAEFVIQYFERTGIRIPERIAMTGLGQPQRPIRIEDLNTFSTARALYADWLEHFEQIAEYKWIEEDQTRSHINKEVSPEENRKKNTLIQKAMIEGLYFAQEFDCLMELSKRSDVEQIVRLHALIYGVRLLLEAEEIKEATKLLKDIDFSTLTRTVYNDIILQFSKHGDFAEITPFINVSFLPPTLFDDLIEKGGDYKLSEDLFELYNCLRVHFLQNANSYNFYMLKASSYKQPASGFFTAIIELAKLWVDTVTGKMSQISKGSKCKQILNYLNIDRQSIDESNKIAFDRYFISRDIHRVYILLFDYVVENLESSQITDVVQHWLLLDAGKNGFKSNYTHIEFAKRLSKLAIVDIKPFIIALLKRAEALSRVDEETSELVNELLECVKAYGYCGYKADAERLWQEIYNIACGVNYRKDYQFNEAVATLKLAHQVHPEKSLARLAKLLHLAHQLFGAARERIPALALQSLIAFACDINLELALELLYREDAYIIRESAICEIIDANSDTSTVNLRYLWAIIRTMDKWDDFNIYGDTTYPTMFNFFRSLLRRKELELATEIYDFCKQQFLVEKGRPESIYDFAELCEKHSTPISSSLIDIQQFKSAKDEVLQKEAQHNSSPLLFQKSRRLELPTYSELHQLSEKDFDAFEQLINSAYCDVVRTKRRSELKRGYHSLKQLFDEWYKQQSIEIQEQTDLLSLTILKSYVHFLQKVGNLLVQSHQNKYHQSVSALFDELRLNVQTITTDIGLIEYFDKSLNIQNWLKQITQGGMTSFEFDREITQHIYTLLENSSLGNMARWEQFCRQWIHRGELTKVLIKIAQRIKKINKVYSRELLMEAWNANRDFFFEYGPATEEFFNVYFEVAPDQAKGLLLKSFYHQCQRYPDSIIHRLDIVSKFATQSENENIYDYLYTQYEDHNQLLILGLSEKPTDYKWITKYTPKCSPEDAIIQYLVRLFDYPEVEVRKLALDALFCLILSDRVVLEKVLLFCENASSNCKEHALSLTYTVVITNPDWILPLRSSLMQWLDYPHFNIKQAVKELLLYCATRTNSPFEQWEIDKIQMTNTRPQVLLPTLAEGELLKGKQFIPSSYQSRLMYKLWDYQENDSISSKLYTRLRYMGWSTEGGMEQESLVHRRHNINANFDNIEINGPYFQAVQEAINTLMDKELKEQSYGDNFIADVKYDFRLYDPSDSLAKVISRPNKINRVGTGLSDEQFLAFDDLTNLSDGWKVWDDECVVLYESGHQRAGERYSSDTKRTCHFTVISFLVSSDWSIDQIDLNTVLPFSPFISRENIYRHELPYVLPLGNSFPISRVRPVVGISKREFRGQDDLSIAALLPDFANELQVVPTITLNYERDGETPIKLIQWQEKYDQGRRRQKPFSAGVRLQIEREMLQKYLEDGQWSIHYIFHCRRSIGKYTPEKDMEWEEFDRVGKLTLADDTFFWL
ncbi:MAG: hypothetical protein OT477_06355 [Chloroflexi bacterium]|nr:hypothetical protein [Chloroflexota bacterium]